MVEALSRAPFSSTGEGSSEDAPTHSVAVEDGHLTEASKASMLAGDVRTDWATPAADALVAALKADVLG